MKKIIVIYVFIWLVNVPGFAQSPPVPDSLMPPKRSSDTVKEIPKLTGGALIDTINTKKNKDRPRPVQNDSLQKKPVQKVRRYH